MDRVIIALGSEGEIKGKEFYVKLIPRELSERKGFQDYFLQEGQSFRATRWSGCLASGKFWCYKVEALDSIPMARGQGMLRQRSMRLMGKMGRHLEEKHVIYEHWRIFVDSNLRN